MNNVMPIVFIGFALLTIRGADGRRNIRDLINFWGVAALVGFPLFLAGYFASGTDSGFLSWVLAYAGESGSAHDQLYGLKMNLEEWVSAGAGLLFYLLAGNYIETAGLGTVLKVLVNQQPLEFIPNYTKIGLSIMLMPILVLSVGMTGLWSLKRALGLIPVRLLVAWLLGYLVFNFIWPYFGDLFWFQQLPLIWLLLIGCLGFTTLHTQSETFERPVNIRRLIPLGLVVVCLLVLNTMHAVMPLVRDDLEANHRLHQAMLQAGDLEIVPGWDNYKWMMQDESGKPVRKLLLANIMLKNPSDNEHISKLANIVETHLSQGHRVVVGRLYNLDRESNPWYGLSDAGWPREKIHDLLKGFCRKKLARIDDVEFYQLYHCDTAVRLTDSIATKSP